VALLLGGDAEVGGVVLLTLKVAGTATLIACALGLPLGFFLATRPFWGRRAAFTLVSPALALPPVVTGLLLFGLLSRRGALGGLGWLYTLQALALGDGCIAPRPGPGAVRHPAERAQRDGGTQRLRQEHPAPAPRPARAADRGRGAARRQGRLRPARPA